MAKNEYIFSGLKEAGGESQLFAAPHTGATSFATVKQTIIPDSIGRSHTELDHRIKLDDDDLVEVELDEITLLMTVSELRACSLSDTDCAKGAYKLPTRIADSQDSRGLVGLAIRALRVLGINLPALAIQRAAGVIESWIKDSSPGLYKVDITGALTRQSLPADPNPVLLLLHGTASATNTAFASLLPGETQRLSERDQRWESLYQQFDGRIFALEQKTLTETPIANVLQFLAQWSPQGGPPLVLLSHSRGGIVGDFLSSLQHWETLSPQLLDALGKDSTEAKQLLALQNKISGMRPDTRPNVLRHIRVGTPAAGTTLASDKTHIWLSVLSNLAGMVPGIGRPFSALADLAVAVVKEGLEPGTLPGIDAQKPDSAFVKVAQLLRCEQTDLLAVTGDSQGAIKKVIRVIFGDNNDLVVNTHSMLLGPQYKTRHQLAISDNKIIHTAYFEHPMLKAALSNALDGNLPGSGFHERGQRVFSHFSGERGRVSNAAPDESTDKPCIFLLPGIMGSELSVGPENNSQDIWLDIWRLVRGLGSRLSMGDTENVDAADRVKATGVLAEGYERFVEYVRTDKRFHLVPQGYDWRHSVFAPVETLEAQIQQRLAAAEGQSIVLVCHSMGGLVARAWRIRHKETWEKVVAGGGRMLQLGTPNYGSWTVPRILLGEEKILLQLALADMRNDKSYWLKMISQFPGLLELCDFEDHLKLSTQAGWKKIGIDNAVIPEQKLLDAAWQNRQALDEDKFEGDENIIYIGGVSEKTPALNKAGTTFSIIDQPYAGDGRVLWPEGEEQKLVNYYLPAVHGDLLNNQQYFDAILELALSGTTRALKTRRPTASDRGESVRPVNNNTVRERLGLTTEVVLFPRNVELQAAALGGSVSLQHNGSPAPDQTLTLSVTHGNLMYRNCPVMVGHYVGDGIKRAEQALDFTLGGVLTQRWNLGKEFYAGAVGTHEVALRQQADKGEPGPNGAIVVGLGRMGELQKGDLMMTVRNGVLKYAQMCSEQGRDCSALKLASLLIGSGQEALELLDVLHGIVRGVELANKIMAKSREDDARVIRVAELEFIEWHLDLAIAARHTLEHLRTMLPFEPVIRPGLHKVDGGHKRAHLQENTDWWDSLKVRMLQKKRPGKQLSGRKRKLAYPLATLSFSMLGGRALGISAAVTFNPREIDTFLTPVLSDTGAPDPRQIEALFEQLIPTPLKPLAAQRRNLIVNMDPASAYLPWEIIVDRKSPNGDPVAVAAGMVRRIIPEADELAADRLIEYAEDDSALIVGNPPGGAAFANLSGAYTESRQIARLLKENHWAVNEANVFENTELLTGQKTAANIRRDILVEDYRILHFAAHGVHDSDDPANSGVVIGYDHTTGAVELFGPHHVRAIRFKPSLVFINCCHTGRLEEEGFASHKLSASLAAEFIKSGVHCVIGAGWAVDDAAALDFATTIYSCLVRGEDFGYAVRRARERVYKNHSVTNTWAAFQCYGDPGFVLSRHGGSLRQDGVTAFVHISEMLCVLENIRSDLCGSKGPGSSGSGDGKLRETNGLFAVAEAMMDEETGKSWSQRGDILNHFAIIYCELDEESRALEFMELASAADRSNVSLADLLTVANYQARYAERRFYTTQQAADANSEKSRWVKAQCAETIEAVIESLKLYRHVHRSACVHQNLASAYKLYAMINADNSEVKCEYIKLMTEEYTAAVACVDSKDVYYPASNAILGHVLLRKVGVQSEEETLVEIERLKEIARSALPGDSSKDFWGIVANLDTNLIIALEENRLTPALAKETARQIIKASANYGSAGQRDSVVKQFRCMAILCEDQGVRDSADAACKLFNAHIAR